MKFLGQSKIIHKDFLIEDVFRFHVERYEAMGEIKPGQFFNLDCGKVPYLKRPISVSGITEKTIEFTVKVIGEGTQYFSSLEAGDEISLMGPLGNGFNLEQDIQKALIIGGGIGVAPLKALGYELKNRNEKMTLHSVIGFNEAIYYLEAFDDFSERCIAVSEVKVPEADCIGYVTEPILELLEEEAYEVAFICGPMAMIKNLQGILKRYNVKMQLLLEEKMACGVGACLVCSCKVKNEKGKVTYKRMCKDGPMFYGDEVIFDEE